MGTTLTDPIVWILVAPLVAACLAFVIGGRARAAVAIAGIGAISAATAGLVADALEHGTRTYALGGWLAPLGIGLRADGLSVFLVALTTTVGVPTSVYALGYLPRRPSRGRDLDAFWPLWLFCWLGLNVIHLSADVFNLYVGLELVGMSAVALVALAGGAAQRAALRYVLVTLVGSLAYLLGVGLLYAQHGALDLASLATVPRSGAALAALVFMIAGLGLKSALFPMHFWLPPAHAHALGPVSAILSALVVTASFYLLARLWLVVFPAVVTLAAAELVGALGAVAIVWGSVQAFRQSSLKMLVAYSTVAQVGYLFVAFPLASHPGGAMAWRGAFYFAASHACAKAAMFLAAASVQQHLGHDDIPRLGGVALKAPMTMLAFGIAGAVLIGLPPTGAFLGKWLLLSAAIHTGHVVIAIVIVVGSLLSALYVFVPLGRTLLDAPDDAAVDATADTPPSSETRRAARAKPQRIMAMATLALALFGVLLGLLPGEPLRLLEIGRPFAAALGAP